MGNYSKCQTTISYQCLEHNAVINWEQSIHICTVISTGKVKAEHNTTGYNDNTVTPESAF